MVSERVLRWIRRDLAKLESTGVRPPESIRRVAEFHGVTELMVRDAVAKEARKTFRRAIAKPPSPETQRGRGK